MGTTPRISNILPIRLLFTAQKKHKKNNDRYYNDLPLLAKSFTYLHILHILHIIHIYRDAFHIMGHTSIEMNCHFIKSHSSIPDRVLNY